MLPDRAAGSARFSGVTRYTMRSEANYAWRRHRSTVVWLPRFMEVEEH